jgi:hypothetical protein
MTTWTHKPTGTVIDRATIDALVKTQWDSPRPAARKAAQRQLLTIGVQLTDIITDLEKRLVRGHEILNEAHDISREDRWLEWLRLLEEAYDALAVIEHRVVQGLTGMPPQRKVVEEVRV